MEAKNLIPWKPWNRFKNKNSLADYSDKNVDRIFEDFIKDFGSFENFLPTFFRNDLSEDLKILPRIDISDTDKEYVVEADFLGVQENDLDVSLSKDGLLTINGKRESVDEQRKRNYYKMERLYGSFERTIDLPENCDNDKVDASFQDGILLVKVPKTEPAEGEIRQIKVAHKKNSRLIM